MKHLSLSTKLTNIPNNCFSACGSLESLIIPNGVETIGESAFTGCEKLSSLHLPETLTYIDTNAFYGCEKLKSLIIPFNMKIIGQNAFYNCSELTQLIFSSVENENNEDVGEQVMTISQGAFNGCKKLKKIILPKNFKTIANDTFEGCISLEELHLLNNDHYTTGSNGANAFASANNLKKIVISNIMLSKSILCGFKNILQSINPQNNLIIQIDGLDIKNPSLVDNEDTTYNKNISTLNGFKSSKLYIEFAGIFKNELNESIVKNMPYQEEKKYKCKFIDINGVDIIDTFGGIDVNNYSQYTLDGENIMLNKYVNIMDTVFNDVKGIILSNNDNTWKMLSNDKESFTIKKDGKIPEKLEHLQLSDNVTALESNALSGSKLFEIKISNISSLPDNLCEGCADLTHFEYNVNQSSSIGLNILKDCISLKRVIINDFHKFMSNNGTLYGCTSLQNIYINYQEKKAGFAGWFIKDENDKNISYYSLPTLTLPNESGLNVHFMNLEFDPDNKKLYLINNDKSKTEIEINEINGYQCFNFNRVITDVIGNTFTPHVIIYDNQGNNFISFP